jgi:DNA mismatch endonuclease (patch repair protein)
MHNCRYGRVKPATRKKFWETKRKSNVERDRRNLKELRKAGWKVLNVWECQTRNRDTLIKKLKDFLSRN